jgi:hypothetical protein
MKSVFSLIGQCPLMGGLAVDRKSGPVVTPPTIVASRKSQQKYDKNSFPECPRTGCINVGTAAVRAITQTYPPHIFAASCAWSQSFRHVLFGRPSGFLILHAVAGRRGFSPGP